MAQRDVKRQEKISRLLANMKASDKTVRRETVRRLGDFRDPAVIKALRGLLRDPDWKIRRAALSSLGRQEQEGLVADIAPALWDTVISVRKEAAKALGRLGDIQGIEPLLEAFADAKSSVREAAQEAVLRFGVKAVAPLCRLQPHLPFGQSVYAAQVLCAMAQRGTNYPISSLSENPVPIAILTTTDLNPQEKWAGLLVLHSMDRAYLFVLLWRTSRSVEHLCEMVLKANPASSEIERGGRDVRDYLTLARPGQRTAEAEYQTLLRAAGSGEWRSQVAQLLRPSDNDDTEEGSEQDAVPPTLFQKIAHLFRRKS